MCPTVTNLPIVHANPGSVCITELSWIFVPSPKIIGSLSPLRVQWNQTLESFAICTSPITVASGAIQKSSFSVLKVLLLISIIISINPLESLYSHQNIHLKSLR